MNIQQWLDLVDKTKPSRGDRGKRIKFTLNVALMHKLIVYGNGVTNPPLTKPHGMKYIS